MSRAPDDHVPWSRARQWVAILGATLVVVGLATVLAAGLLAPLEPAMFPTGGSCQLATCGELVDPPSWRAMWVVFGIGCAMALAGLTTAVAALPGGLPRVGVPRAITAVVVLCLAVPAPLGLAFAGGSVGSMHLGYALPLVWVVVLGGCVHVLLFRRTVTRRSVLVVLVPALAPYAIPLAVTLS